MTAKLRLACTSCGKKLAVPASFAGKIVKCPACGGSLQVPRSRAPAVLTTPSLGDTTEVRASAILSAPRPRRRRPVFFLALVVSGLAVAGTLWWRSRGGPAGLTRRLQAGEVAEIQRLAEAFTGRKFSKSVPLLYEQPGAFAQRLLASSGLRAQDFERLEKVLDAFGVPPGRETVALSLRRLLQQEVAAFYDFKAQQIVVRSDHAALLPADTPQELREAARKALLLHEFVHALQHQTLAFFQLLDQRLPDDDLLLALKSVLEGEAMQAYHQLLATAVPRGSLSEADYAMRLSHQQSGWVDRGATLAQVLQLLAAERLRGSVEDRAGFLRWSLQAPYELGMPFVVRAARSSPPWDFLARPPLASSELDKWFPGSRPVDRPRLTLRFSEPGRLSGPGWRLIEENSFGKAVRSRLGEITRFKTRYGSTSPGARADRYAVLEREGRLASILYARSDQWRAPYAWRSTTAGSPLTLALGLEEVTVFGLDAPEALAAARRGLRSVVGLETRDLTRIVEFLSPGRGPREPTADEADARIAAVAAGTNRQELAGELLSACARFPDQAPRWVRRHWPQVLEFLRSESESATGRGFSFLHLLGLLTGPETWSSISSAIAEATRVEEDPHEWRAGLRARLPGLYRPLVFAYPTNQNSLGLLLGNSSDQKSVLDRGLRLFPADPEGELGAWPREAIERQATALDAAVLEVVRARWVDGAISRVRRLSGQGQAREAAFLLDLVKKLPARPEKAREVADLETTLRQTGGAPRASRDLPGLERRDVVTHAASQGSRLLVLTRQGIHCYDLDSLRPLWKQPDPQPDNPEVHVGDLEVFYVFHRSQLEARAWADGRKLWARESTFGLREVLILPGVLVTQAVRSVQVQPLAALDATSGQARWTLPGSTWLAGGKLGVVVKLANPRMVACLDPMTGRERWRVQGGERDRACHAYPVPDGSQLAIAWERQNDRRDGSFGDSHTSVHEAQAGQRIWTLEKLWIEPKLAIGAEGLLCLSDRRDGLSVSLRARSSGRTQWERRLRSSSDLVAVNESVVVYMDWIGSQRNLVCAEVGDQRIRWTVRSESLAGRASLHGNHMIVDTGELLCYRLTDGVRQWEWGGTRRSVLLRVSATEVLVLEGHQVHSIPLGQ